MKFDTIKVKFVINIKDIVYINSIIDSYEGIGIVRTIDPKEGLVAVYTNDFMKKYLYEVIDALKGEGYKIDNISEEKTESVDNW
ncbi:MAG: hypothetical protein PWQ25_756 [Deferribacteres bacterium]|jgi:hypothetical protein|nr:hypothetical protein [Deferribacteres bacterium]